MTNQQCRQLLLFNNRKTMNNLLSKMNLSFSDSGRDRIYHSPENGEFKHSL
ncbi:hypothetical protein ACFFIX_05865 [Metabacillus herbersteinensis]|uniref:Fur-regulated basic protein FbpA n=1 Tax=Metabacillus herbersteinensis TaxID=283816 RepID=A0ABV6GBW6_9BACI